MVERHVLTARFVWTVAAVGLTSSAWAATPTLTVSPWVLNFTYTPSQSTLPASQNISVGGGSSILPFTVTAAVVSPAGGGWLSVSPNSGRSPLAVKVTVNPTGLPIGTYAGTIMVTAPAAGNSPRSVAVTLTVKSPPVVLTISPATLTFNHQVGTAAPAAQTLTLTTSGSFLSYSTTSRAGSRAGTTTGGTWLTATPPSGLVFTALRATLSVTVNPTDLFPGNYTGSITISSPGASTPTQIVSVTLVVTPGVPQITSLWPADIVQGSAATTLTITGAGFYSGSVPKARLGATDTNLSFTLLSPTLMTAIVPASLLSAPATLEIRVTNPNPAGDSNTVNLPVVAPGPKISAAGTVNAASLLSGDIAPGEIIVIFGSGLGVPTIQEAGGGNLATTLAGTQVLFDATAAPLVYTHERQVAAIVPYSVSGATTSMTVVYNAATSNAVTLNVAAASPALFTLDGSGRGAVAAVNSDGTINGPANAASRGSIVSLFCTGEGQTNPAGVDGQINTGPTYPAPILQVSVAIGGQDAEVLYAGGAGGGVSGVCEIHLKIPDNAVPGSDVPVSFTVGAITSPNGTTISVK